LFDSIKFLNLKLKKNNHSPMSCPLRNPICSCWRETISWGIGS